MKSKRIFPFLLSILLLSSALVGCTPKGGKTSESERPSEPGTSEVTPSEEEPGESEVESEPFESEEEPSEPAESEEESEPEASEPEESEVDSDVESETEIEKRTPVIEIGMEDNVQLDVAEDFVLPRIVVTPADIQYNVRFTSYNGETDLGEEAPYDYGDYALKVTTIETDEYLSATKSVHFYLRQFFTASLFANGEKLEAGTEFDQGTDVTITAEASVAGLTPTIKFSQDVDGATIDLGSEFPTEIGTYGVSAVFERTDRYAYVKVSTWFRVVAAKLTPEIHLFLNGEALPMPNSEGNHWINLGYNQSQYYPNELPELTWTVSPEDVEYSAGYYINDVEVDKLPTSVDKITTVKLVVKTVEDAKYKQVSEYALFALKPVPTKDVPEIKFFLDGEYIDIKKNGNHWVAGGYNQSKFYLDEPPVITWTVEPESLVEKATVVFEHEGEKVSDTMPTVANSYSMKVSVPETEEYGAASEYVNFKLIDRPVKDVPKFTIKMNGEVLDLSKSHWANGDYANSQYYVDEAPVFTWSVEPETIKASVSAFYEQDEVFVSNTMPTVAGTYTFKVTVEETDEATSGFQYVNFALIDRPAQEKVTPTISFFLGSDPITVSEESHWVNETPADSKYYVDEPPAITYRLSPEDAVATVSYVRDDGVTSTTMPTTAGTYSMTVSVAESDTFNAASEYVLFQLIDRPAVPKDDPTIKIMIGGEVIDIEGNGNHWVNGSYKTSRFLVSNPPTLSFSVEEEGVTASAMFYIEDNPMGTSMPRRAGTYTYKVTTTETDDYNSVSEFVYFELIAEQDYSIAGIPEDWTNESDYFIWAWGGEDSYCGMGMHFTATISDGKLKFTIPAGCDGFLVLKVTKGMEWSNDIWDAEGVVKSRDFHMTELEEGYYTFQYEKEIENVTVTITDIPEDYKTGYDFYVWVWSESKFVPAKLNEGSLVFSFPENGNGFNILIVAEGAEADWNNKVTQSGDYEFDGSVTTFAWHY